MDNDARLKLTQMIEENNVTDQTDLIRELHHSAKIREDSRRMVNLLEEYKHLEYTDLRTLTTIECNFLFSYYTDIYNRILKKELDISILDRFLSVLERIESGEIGQHEGSYLVGQTLKELYIDSALKKSEQLDKKYDSEKETVTSPEPLHITWRMYKSTQNVTYDVL